MSICACSYVAHQKLITETAPAVASEGKNAEFHYVSRSFSDHRAEARYKTTGTTETREGRRAIFEVLPVTESIRQGLYQKADSKELTLRARREGVRLMPDVLSEWLDSGLIAESVYDQLLGERGLT